VALTFCDWTSAVDAPESGLSAIKDPLSHFHSPLREIPESKTSWSKNPSALTAVIDLVKFPGAAPLKE
jgi:hypothetical protein